MIYVCGGSPAWMTRDATPDLKTIDNALRCLILALSAGLRVEVQRHACLQTASFQIKLSLNLFSYLQRGKIINKPSFIKALNKLYFNISILS